MPNIVTRDETGLRSSKVCCKSFDHLQHLRTVHETLSASSVCSNQISLLCVERTHLSILCNQSLFSVQVRSRHSSMRIWFPKPWTLPTFTPSRHFPDLSVCTAANVKTLYYTLYSFSDSCMVYPSSWNGKAWLQPQAGFTQSSTVLWLDTGIRWRVRTQEHLSVHQV